MARPIITHHWQGNVAAIAERSANTLYINTAGGARKAVITRFEWMSQGAYDGLAVKADTTLYIINSSMRGRGTSHRWPLAADTATAFYLGGTQVDRPTFGGVPPALAEAVGLWDARYSVEGEQLARNFGTGGSALDAQYGSVLGAYVRDGALVLPGAINNYASVPHEAAFDPLVDDFEIVTRIVANSLADQTIIGKQANTSTRQFWFYWDSNQRIGGWLSFDGSATTALINVGQFDRADGETFWLKITRNATTGRVDSFDADDQETEPTVWTSIGGFDGTAGSTFASSSPIEIGTRQSGTSGAFTGDVYRTIVRDGIDGTAVLDVDLANVPDWSTEFTAATGQTVTVNSTGVDTNDPLLLTRTTGENYLYVVGGTTNSTMSTTVGAPQLNGDLDLRFEWEPMVAPPTNRYDFFGGGNVDPNRSFVLGWNQNRTLRYSHSQTGSGFASTVNTTAPTSFGAGERFWIRVTHDIDNGAGGNTVTFFESGDGATWDQIGDPIVTGGAFSWPTLTTPALFIGDCTQGANITNAKVFNAEIRTAVDGLIVDFNSATDITDSGAYQVTPTVGPLLGITRPTTGRKTALVTRPIWLMGTDDLLEVADNALLDFDTSAQEEMTVVYVARQWDNQTGVFITKNPSPFASPPTGHPGWSTYNFGQRFVWDDGTDKTGVLSGSGAPSGPLATISAVLESDGTATTYNSNTEIATGSVTEADYSNAEPLNIGKLGNNATYSDMELVAVAVWRRALTTDEIAEIADYYGTGA